MKTHALLILMFFCTISVMAQPWIGTAPGNIYYNSGNVGIGTATPEAKLGLESATTNTNAILIIGDRTNIGGKSIYFSRPSSGSIINIQGSENGVGSANIALQASGGNIGIGTATPMNKLQIGACPYDWIDNDLVVGNLSNNKALAIHSDANRSYVYSSGRLDLYGNQVCAMSLSSGNVGIGTNSPAYKLDVIGTIRANEIKVDLNGADFVFESGYKLMPLNELETFVKEQKHLPEVASAKEMHQNGTDLGNLNSKLLQKMEEMTLYMIAQNKKLEQQNREMKEMKERIEELETSK